MEVYKILQNIMDERGLSIPDIARASGLSDSTVRGIIVRKQKSIALEVAFKLAQGLNISIEHLNGEEPTILHSNEYPVMTKYRRLDSYEKDRVDDFIDHVLAGVPIDGTVATQKKPAPTDEGELDSALIEMLLQLQLSPHELQRLIDFAKGLAAARTEPPSDKYPDR